MPHLLKDLSKSQKAYKQYFDKKGNDDANLSGDKKKKTLNPMELVRPDSPGWRGLQKDHKTPDQIRNTMENHLVKEIPETTHKQRT